MKKKRNSKKKKKKRICLQCGRPGFDLSVGKITWKREKLPTPVFWSREFHGLYSPWGRKESDTTERLSLTHLEPEELGMDGVNLRVSQVAQW